MNTNFSVHHLESAGVTIANNCTVNIVELRRPVLQGNCGTHLQPGLHPKPVWLSSSPAKPSWFDVVVDLHALLAPIVHCPLVLLVDGKGNPEVGRAVLIVDVVHGDLDQPLLAFLFDETCNERQVFGM